MRIKSVTVLCGAVVLLAAFAEADEFREGTIRQIVSKVEARATNLSEAAKSINHMVSTLADRQAGEAVSDQEIVNALQVAHTKYGGIAASASDFEALADDFSIAAAKMKSQLQANDPDSKSQLAQQTADLQGLAGALLEMEPWPMMQSDPALAKFAAVWRQEAQRVKDYTDKIAAMIQTGHEKQGVDAMLKAAQSVFYLIRVRNANAIAIYAALDSAWTQYERTGEFMGPIMNALGELNFTKVGNAIAEDHKLEKESLERLAQGDLMAVLARACFKTEEIEAAMADAENFLNNLPMP